MSLEFNAENRNANMYVRCCSFCRRPGHNITRCDSPAIRNFERKIFNYMTINMNVDILDDTHRRELRQYLLNESLSDSNLVRAFAISRCGASTRSDIVNCIDLIMRYFIPQDGNVNQEETQHQTDSPARRRPGFLGRDNRSLLYAVMFIEMIRAMSESNRKFDINTNVLQDPANLEEKCECGICYEECANKNIVKLNCGHEFCKDCIKQTLQNERKLTPCCAYCRTDITNFELKLESVKNEFNDLIN